MVERRDNKDSNIIDYLRWRGDLSFENDPFNEADNLVLCVLSYINFPRLDCARVRRPEQALTLRELCPLLTEEDGQRGLSDRSYIPVLRLAAQTERFGQVKVFAASSVHTDETQFDAMTFLLPGGNAFIAFMGTDSSLVGWREDLDMSYEIVPAQELAAQYALEVAQICAPHRIYLGGHSKGGNLAAWAAIHLPEDVQNYQLIAAYNNDGPGFNTSMAETDGMRRIKDKLVTLVPESSIVGILLTHAEDYTVIDSNSYAVMQHDPLTWQVEGKSLVHLAQRTQIGEFSDNVLQDWIASLTPDERRDFSDALFDVLSDGGKIKTLDQLRGQGNRLQLLKSYTGTNEKQRTIINDVFRRLAVNIREQMYDDISERADAALRHIKNR